MVLTRDFKELVVARAEREPAFRTALLTEAVECILNDELDTAKSLLRDYVNATIGFQELGQLINKEPKSLMRMLSTTGNPRTKNLMEIFEYLQQAEGVQLEVKPV